MVKLYKLKGFNASSYGYYFQYPNTEKRIIEEVNKAIKDLGLSMNRGDIIDISNSEERYGCARMYIWDEKPLELSRNDNISNYSYIPKEFTLNDQIFEHTYQNVIFRNSIFWPTLEQRTQIVSNLRYGNMFTKYNTFYSYYINLGRKIPFVLFQNYIENDIDLADYEKIFRKDFTIDSEFESKYLACRGYSLDADTLDADAMDANAGNPINYDYLLTEPITLEFVEDHAPQYITANVFEESKCIESNTFVSNTDKLGDFKDVEDEVVTLINDKYLIYESDSDPYTGKHKRIYMPLNLDAIKEQLMNMDLPFSLYDDDYSLLKDYVQYATTFNLMVKPPNSEDLHPNIEYNEQYYMFDEYYSKLFDDSCYI